jgi:LacI family transcriptional regulator
VRRITLSDVADRAGVSKSTASKALSNRYGVSAETRASVERAARELGFSPSAVARQLALGKTSTVGVLTGDLEGRFVIPILAGAEDALGAGELSVILCDARGDSIRERRHLRTLLERRIDGLIVVAGARTEPRESLGADLSVPVVYAYAPSSAPGDVSVVADQAMGGRLAAEHMWNVGRRRIAYVGGDTTYAASSEREAGVREALKALGGDLTALTEGGSWDERWGRHAAGVLMDCDDPPDAIIAASDTLARACLDAMRDRGVRCPQDVAVLGFDNLASVVPHTRPPLTSIDLELRSLGQRAAFRIFQALDGDPGPVGTEARPVSLVVRESTMADLPVS